MVLVISCPSPFLSHFASLAAAAGVTGPVLAAAAALPATVAPFRTATYSKPLRWNNGVNSLSFSLSLSLLEFNMICVSISSNYFVFKIILFHIDLIRFICLFVYILT